MEFECYIGIGCDGLVKDILTNIANIINLHFFQQNHILQIRNLRYLRPFSRALSYMICFSCPGWNVLNFFFSGTES